MVYRPNYEIPVSTRIDAETKQKLDNIASAQKRKLSELLRDIILEFIEQKSGEYLQVDNDQIKQG